MGWRIVQFWAISSSALANSDFTKKHFNEKWPTPIGKVRRLGAPPATRIASPQLASRLRAVVELSQRARFIKGVQCQTVMTKVG